MSWHKQDDDFWTSPKIALAGESAAILFQVLLGINSRRERGGELQPEDLEPTLLRVRLGAARRTPKQIQRMLADCVRAGLIVLRDDGGATIVGFDSEWSPRSGHGFAAVVGTTGALSNAERQARHRNARRNGHAVTSNVTRNGESNGASNGDRNGEAAESNGERNAPRARASGSGSGRLEVEKNQNPEGGGGGECTSHPKGSGSGEPGSGSVLGSARYAPRYVHLTAEQLEALGPEVGEPQPILRDESVRIRRRERERLCDFTLRRAHTEPHQVLVKK